MDNPYHQLDRLDWLDCLDKLDRLDRFDRLDSLDRLDRLDRLNILDRYDRFSFDPKQKKNLRIMCIFKYVCLKNQLYTNVAKDDRWLKVVITEWFVWN